MGRIPHRRAAIATAAGLAGVAALTAALWALHPHVEVLSLVVCYQLLVLVVSGLAGTVPGLVTALVSVLSFNWFFLPPVHTLTVADSRNWISLAVFGATALITSQLAAGSRRQREATEARGRDAAAIAGLARSALADVGPDAQHDDLARAAADALGVTECRIALGDAAAEGARRRLLGREEAADGALPLVVRGRPIGLLEVGEPRADRAVAPGPAQGGAVAGVVALAIERGQLVEQLLEIEALRRSDEMKTALLRGVSHEFRTPLTAMRTAGEALMHDPPPPDAPALLAVMTGETVRLERLVANLLDLSRLEGGGLMARMEWCDPLEIAAGAIAAAAPLLDGREVDLRAPDDPPLVRADAVLCERVLVNLLHNAARHGAPPITLAITVAEGAVELSVEDRGAGPDPLLGDRLFAPFAAGRATGGTGVGLALARGFAQAQGATLTACRRDGGTAFTLALPRSPVPEVA